MPPWAVSPAGCALSPTRPLCPPQPGAQKGLKALPAADFLGEQSWPCGGSGAGCRRGGTPEPRHPPGSPDWPTQAPRAAGPPEPQCGCRDTGDVQPLPGTTGMPVGSPQPCPGMGSPWQGYCLPLLSRAGGHRGPGGQELGHRSLLILPGKVSVGQGLSWGCGDCDVVAVAANLGCDRAGGPLAPTSPSLAPRRTWSCCGGSALHKAPSSARHLPCECGPCPRVPSSCHQHLVPGAGSARAGGSQNAPV